jgi:carboxypeptidase Taq
MGLMDTEIWEEFAAGMCEQAHLGSVSALLGWDEQTMMPPRAAPGRAAASGTVAALFHERLTSTRFGDLIEILQDEDLPAERRAMVEMARRNRDKAVRLPPGLVREMAETASLSQAAWVRARQADDYSIFEPLLGKTLSLKAQQAEALGYEKELYDAHLDLFERGATAGMLLPMFESVTAGLAPILAAVAGKDTDAWTLPEGPYDTSAVFAYCKDLLGRMGYDMEAGRLDLSAHPFSTGIGPGDVRLTTRIQPEDSQEAILATLHEMGHGLYELGLPPEWSDTSIGDAASLGVHESQSRLWENHVGRSLAFWEGELPHAQKALAPWNGQSPRDIYRAVNRVVPSLIRVKADEVTYPLHVAIRFELELGICRGEITTADLPRAWNEAYREHLGVTPPNNADGVLQDVHWSLGYLGYFPTYLIGSVYSAALFEAATRALGGEPAVADQFRSGTFAPLLAWLRDNIHSQGSAKLPGEIVAAATGTSEGGGIDTAPFLNYLSSKYGDLYSFRPSLT